MSAVASVTRQINTGTPCADDAWRAGTNYDRNVFVIARHNGDEYDAGAIDRLITSGRYGAVGGPGWRCHLAYLGVSLADRTRLTKA